MNSEMPDMKPLSDEEKAKLNEKPNFFTGTPIGMGGLLIAIFIAGTILAKIFGLI